MVAELGMVRRESGLRSWDAFFRAILQKWNSPSTPAPSAQGAKWIKPLQESIRDVRSDVAAMRGQVAAGDEAIRSLFHEQTQTNELVRRFNTLLAIALEIDPKELDAPGAWSAVMESARKDDVLNKIRRIRE